MEKIIYQTKVFTPLNTMLATLLGLLLLVFGITVYTDLTVTIEDDYPSIFFILILFWLVIMVCFKKFTLTENEFIIEYLPMSIVLKPKKIPLNDIDKLIFKEGKNRTSLPEVQIYRVSKKWITIYNFNLDTDDIQQLINELRSKRIQVECVGYRWK